MNKKASFIASIITFGMAAILMSSRADAGKLETVSNDNIYYADSIQDAAEYIHQRFCVENGREACVQVPGGVDYETLINETAKIDDPDNLYDGSALWGRLAYDVVTFEPNKVKDAIGIRINTTYDVDEADAYGREIASIIIKEAGENASKEEKFYLLLNYFSKNFTYDKERAAEIAIANENATRYKSTPFTNILDTGGTKFICSDYANLFYITASKLDIDAIEIIGERHIYNAVRFSPDNDYSGIDLTAQSAYSCRITKTKLLSNRKLYQLTSAPKATYTVQSYIEPLTCTKYYEFIPQWFYYTTRGIITSFHDYILSAAAVLANILVVAIVVLLIKRVIRRKHHKRLGRV